MPKLPETAVLKAEARRLLREAQISPLRFTLLFLAIDLALAEISAAAGYLFGKSVGADSLPSIFVGVFVSLMSTVLLAGYACYCLGVQRGRAMPYETLFDAFPFAGQAIFLSLLQGLLIALGLILFIVPGFIAAFSYALSLYFLCEDPSIGAVEALRRSRLTMRGYKMQLFALLLSFLPLLLVFSLPIALCEALLRGAFPETLAGVLLDTLADGVLTACASAYLMPYMALAQTGFYRCLTEAEPPMRDDWSDEI